MLQPSEELVQQLKRDDRLLDALALCETSMNETEGESWKCGAPVESWPYLQACVILRKLKRPADEAAVIERFIQLPSSGSKQSKSIVERLPKAYKLAGLTEERSVGGQVVTIFTAEGVPVDERALFVRDAVIIDCETTGLAQTDEIIELALLRFRYSSLSGRILQEVGRYSGLREPSCPISPAASKVNGLTMKDVAGRRIDTQQAAALFDGASIAIAHNASFDRRMVSALFPKLAEMPWYCSMRSIAWLEKGCPSAKLQDIAAYYGIQAPHRAMSDVQAVFELLKIKDGQTDQLIMQELIGGAPLNYVSRWQIAHETNGDDSYSDGGVTVIISAQVTDDSARKPWWQFWK